MLILINKQKYSYSSCTREKLDNEYHKMFNSSNNILCNRSNDDVLSKEEIINPKGVINKIANNVKEPTNKILSLTVEANEILNSDIKEEAINRVKKIISEIKKPTEEIINITKQISNNEIKEEIINVTEEINNTSSDKEAKESTILEIAEKVKKVIEETNEEHVEHVEQVEENLQEDVNDNIKYEIEDQLEDNVKETIEEPVEQTVKVSEPVETTIAPLPFDNSNDKHVLLGHSLGGINDNNMDMDKLNKNILKSSDPKCNVYKDAVTKLNITGYIKNNQVDSSWNDSFGVYCGKM